MRVLLLGGTTEASALAHALAGMPGIAATLSLAGRTRAPTLPPIPHRVGGFGGADGLRAYLVEHRIDALIDATHPFAAQMTRHATQAAAAADVKLLVIRRPAWAPVEGDRWTMVNDMAEAAAALGPTPRRVLLTVGQQELAPFTRHRHHRYVVRSVEPPPPDLLPDATCITARGPFAEPAERALLQAHAIEVLVTKNSGGTATIAKLAAARALNLPVVMVTRPPLPDVAAVATTADALDWLHALIAARGV